MGLHGTYIMVMGQGKARLEFDDLVFVCRAAYVIDALQIQFLLYAYISNHVHLHWISNLRCYLLAIHVQYDDDLSLRRKELLPVYLCFLCCSERRQQLYVCILRMSKDFALFDKS